MLFFSWYTQDTNRSIPNKYSTRATFFVTMIDDKGNKYFEPNYGGEGIFGGKDFYVLLAEMNGMNHDVYNEEEKRKFGYDLAFGIDANGNKIYPSGDNPNIKYPNLVESPDQWEYISNSPKPCESSGYFYYDSSERFSIKSVIENFNKMYDHLKLKMEYSKNSSFDGEIKHSFTLYAKYEFELSKEYSLVLSFTSDQIQFNLSPLTHEQYLAFHQFYELIDWFVFKENSKI